MRYKNDTDRLIEIAEMSRNGHHYSASCELQKMANENRCPNQKKQLWEMASESRKNAR